ncbi:MAG: T9SS type A sorting domain-containing protein [Bacteroidota bacterium]
MGLKITWINVFLFICGLADAQVGNPSVPGTVCQNCPSKGSGGQAVMNGTASIATSYTMSACGLNFTQASIDLHQRAVSPNSTPGAVQPATMTISGIPPCSYVVKAFLYIGVIGNGVPFTPSLVAGGDTQPVPLTLIGTDQSPCWSQTGTFIYKGDVTAFVTGNGNYTISGVPVFPSATDAEGATLFVIYSDLSQSYTGNIVIADGCQVNVGINNVGNSISGFSVCGTPTLTSNFMIIGDLQGLAPCHLSLNTPTTTPNYTTTPSNDKVWDFFSAPGAPASIGQSTASYGLQNTGGDCLFLTLAGMYYRTSCLTCLTQAPLTVTATAAACPSGATVAVSGGIAPYTYTWTGTSQTTSVVTGLSAGNYTVKVADVTGCSLGNATFVVNASPAATIAVNSPPPVCNGSSVALIAGPASSYSWSPVSWLNNNGTASVIASPSVSTVYTLSFSDAMGCIGAATIAVVINPNPLPVIGSNSPLCENANLFLTASGGNSYLWSGPNSFASSLQNPVFPAQLSNSGIYQVIVIGANGCQAFSYTTVSVQPIPFVLANTGLVCVGNPAVLLSGGANTYSWSGPNNFNNNASQNITFPSASFSLAGTYTVTGTAANSCTASATVNLSVAPLPLVTSANVNACEGQTALLIANGASSYNWTGPMNYSSMSATAIVPVTNSLSAGVYTVSGVDNNACSNTTTVSLTVLALPSLNVTGTTTVCLYQPLMITASGAQSYVWNGPSGVVSVSPSLNIASASSVIPITYTVTGTAANFCTVSAVAVIATFPLPSVVINSGKRKVCAAESTTLTASGALNYSWLPQGLPSLNIVIVTPLANTVYTVQGVDINGCMSTADISIFVTPCTAIGENVAQRGGVLVYPNPATGNFTVESNDPMHLMLINTLGQTIREINLNNNNQYRVFVDQVAEGVYYLVSPDQGISEKIILQR